VTKDSPGIVYFKNNFNSLLPFQTCNIFKRGIQIENLINAEIESLPGVVPLKETKKKDLQAMLQYLSEENRLYFEKILSAYTVGHRSFLRLLFFKIFVFYNLSKFFL